MVKRKWQGLFELKIIVYMSFLTAALKTGAG